jgi:E3 ubiquitin-protein ligase RNF144
LVDDPEHGEVLITNVECPHSCRMFYAYCKVAWHAGVTCTEFKFQRPRKDEQDREDLLPRKVEQESKWQMCPECKIYVERIGDCVFIIYRYFSQIEHSLH